MPFPGVRVDIGSNNLLANINIPDAVPAIVCSGVEDATIYSADDYAWAKSDVVVNDFYREVGGSAPLLCVSVDSWTVDNVIAAVSSLLERRPDVNLIAIGEGPSSHTFTQHGALCDDVVSLVTKLKPVMENAQKAGRPARVFLGGHVDVSKGDIAYTPSQAGNGFVSIVLGNSGASNADNPAVGTALGRATKIAAHIKIGDGTLGPLSIEDVNIGTKSYEEIGAAQVERWHDMGFLTFMRRPGLEGWYFGVDNMCASDDFSTLVHGRIIDKAQRLAIAAYMPYVESSMQVADGGKIDAADAEAMAKVIESQLRARMGDQVSNVKVVVPLEQDLVNTHTLRVQVSVLPLGYNTWISVEMNLVNQL